MSLKAVHLVFVTALSALAFGLGVWQVRDYRQPDGTTGDLLFALGAFAAGVLVIVYGKYFLKKLRTVSYL
jgi:DNA-binding transcriptional regulator of glucitol operon